MFGSKTTAGSGRGAAFGAFGSWPTHASAFFVDLTGDWPDRLQRLLTRPFQLLILFMVFIVTTTSAATADTPILSAPDAYRQLQTGDLVVLDIRTPQEWSDTGIADGAWPVSMHSPEFPKQLQAIFSQYSPSEVALICATGGRSAYVADILVQNGIVGVIDISEGMMGNGSAPGWIARDLPVVSATDAAAAYEQAQQTWK